MLWQNEPDLKQEIDTNANGYEIWNEKDLLVAKSQIVYVFELVEKTRNLGQIVSAKGQIYF